MASPRIFALGADAEAEFSPEMSKDKFYDLD